MKKQQRFTRSAIAFACATLSLASNVYAASSTLQKNADGTAYDTATGLTWKRCMEGQTWDGTTCTGTAATYTFDAANALTGKVTFAGQNDWRLPNIRELLTIVDETTARPALDKTVFPNTANPVIGMCNSIPSSAWSSSSVLGYGDRLAWNVDFSSGNLYFFVDSTENRNRDCTYGARLVRGGQSQASLNSLTRPNEDYTDNQDGTVLHKPTNLTWKRCMEGQTWTGSTCTGTASRLAWNDAKAMTSNFSGKTDWRLPTRKELLSLVDYTLQADKTPYTSVNNTMLSVKSSVWSSELCAGFSSGTAIWDVSFSAGTGSSCVLSSNQLGVQLVRGGQSSAPTTLSDTDCFFDWAEARLPNLLTPHKTTQTAGTISYRGAYTSGMYIGVTGDSVLALGGSFGNTATTIGTLSSFLPTARAASCK